MHAFNKHLHSWLMTILIVFLYTISTHWMYCTIFVRYVCTCWASAHDLRSCCRYQRQACFWCLMRCTVWMYFWKVGIRQPDYAQFFACFARCFDLYFSFLSLLLACLYSTFILFLTSLSLLMFWYVIILSGGFLKY